MLKTLLFTMQNGKSISSGMQVLINSSSNKKEKKIYTRIYDDLKDGITLSHALERQKISSIDIIKFISMAEKSANFKNALEKIVNYIETKDNFKLESNEKTSLPITYFFIASIIVLAVKFYAVPMQVERSMTFSPEIVALIKNHLFHAQVMTDILFLALLFFGFYFLILLIALFDKSYTVQYHARKVALFMPFSSEIVKKFEKFALFSMLSSMLQSGIALKRAFYAAIDTTAVSKFRDAMIDTLSAVKTDGRFIHHPNLYDEIERELLRGAGSTKQLGSIMNEISLRAKSEAMIQSSKFFRSITLISILLMAFAVFIEFYTVVLTQIIIQKGIIDAAKGMPF
jgi:type II secretory pathway component PulF